MAIRRFFVSAVVSFSLIASALPGILRAEDAPAPGDVETAKHNFIGVINGTSVFVRSGPREDAYPTMRLDKGDKVTVVGIKFKWLKILPPEGSFAYVPKAYVNQRGDGKLGRASREVIAKVGSTLNQLKTAPMAKIDEGQDVEIIGDQDEYYKVKPPEGTYLYVNASFVDPVQAIATPAELKANDAVASVTGNHSDIPKTPTATAKPTDANEGSTQIAKTEAPSVGAPEAAPTTQPAEAVASATDTFSKLEEDFKLANEKPITDQPVDVLLNGYSDLLKQDALTGQSRKIAEIRVSTLKLRGEAKTEFLAEQQTQVQAADRQKALFAEREEIQQRIKEQQVTFYAAVGTLRASSIQQGNGTLFRLTDPSTGRTIAYIRTDDAKYATLVGQFVGVKGNITTDAALNIKVIDQPTAAESVDPSKVNSSVAAQIVPPSLMPKATARAGD